MHVRAVLGLFADPFELPALIILSFLFPPRKEKLSLSKLPADAAH